MADAPWCQKGDYIDPSLRISYWVLIIFWICNILLGGYGTYKLFWDNKSKRKLFKVLYVLISICFCISPPGFAFGLQSGWECWYGDNFHLWEGIFHSLSSQVTSQGFVNPCIVRMLIMMYPYILI